MTTLKIHIGPTLSPLRRLANLGLMLGSILVIPTYNEFILSGHWSVHLAGALIGMIAAAAVVNTAFQTKKFTNPEDAAAWVASREWENDE